MNPSSMYSQIRETIQGGRHDGESKEILYST
jgi:hypothetical protein